MNHSQNTISIDEAKFKKTSKKLLNKLQELPTENIKDLKLTQLQEIFAESLGFRNLFELQHKTFNNVIANDIQSVDLNNIAENKKNDVLKLFYIMNYEQSLNMITNLMDSSDSFRYGRSIALIKSVLLALFYMRDEQEILLYTDAIREHLIFDNLIKLYKCRRDFPTHIRASLRNYLISLPGFQESAPKQTDVTTEQHDYIQMSFASVFDALIKIEKNDFVLAEYNWFVVENKKTIIETNDLSTKNLENNDWQPNPKIRNLDFFEDSWIPMRQFYIWVHPLYVKNKLTSLKVSDLIFYISNIIEPLKKEKMKELLNVILSNYSTASDMSDKIIQSLKE